MQNSSYYIAPVGVRTHDLPLTVASNTGKVSYALTHSAMVAVLMKYMFNVIAMKNMFNAIATKYMFNVIAMKYMFNVIAMKYIFNVIAMKYIL